MLLQTNSYVVPKDKRNEHARLVRRFRQTLGKLGCEHFEVYEQVSQNWGGQDSGGRFVQIMRFRDRRHQLDVQAAERSDPAAQALIQEFCELINFPFQQQQGLFAVGFYNSVLPTTTAREPLASEQAVPLVSGENDLEDIPTADPEAEPLPTAPFGLADTAPATHAPVQPASPEPASRALRRPTVAPIFFENTVAEHATPPAAPKLGADELDSGITDLSDSNLMQLDLPPSEGTEFDEQPALAMSNGHAFESAEPAEQHDLAASVDDLAADYLETLDEAVETHNHLEGHTEVEPERKNEPLRFDGPNGHSHMRLAQDHPGDEPTAQDSDVELFEPEEPVSPFGN